MTLYTYLVECHDEEMNCWTPVQWSNEDNREEAEGNRIGMEDMEPSKTYRVAKYRRVEE